MIDIKQQIENLCIALDDIPLEGLKKGTFEWALSHLKSGNVVMRESWGGQYRLCITEIGLSFDRFISVQHSTSNSEKVYTPTFDDIFAEDWEI